MADGEHDVDEHVQVALAIVVGIHEMVEDPADQIVVVTDVVRRWHMLDDAGRERYAEPANPSHTPLMRFAWEFTEAIDRAAVADLPESCGSEAAESAALRYWRSHVQQLRAATERGRVAASLHRGRTTVAALSP